MQFRVIPSLWKAGNQIYQKGDLVPDTVLARLGPVDSWRRLGLIEPANDWWNGLTKKQLVDECEARGIDLPAAATKKDILEQIEGGP